MNRRKTQNWGALGPRLLQRVRGCTPKYKPLPMCVTTANLVVQRHSVYRDTEENPQNWGALRPRPIAVGTG